MLLFIMQLAVYGKESMRRMAAANVLVVGLSGLGVEIGGYIDARQIASMKSRSANSSFLMTCSKECDSRWGEICDSA